MIVKAITTRIFKEGENIFGFITHNIQKIKNGSILIITSKIIALSEKRTAVIENSKTKEKLIKKESEWAKKTKYCWLTVKDNMVMASAGIDASNGNGKLILLPKDSFKTAHFLRRQLKRFYKINNLGIIVTDSRSLPLRAGVTGIALGYSGFTGIRDYRGKPDIFGRKFHFSRTNIVDGLATAAVLCMGEGDERRPLCVIDEAPVVFTKKTNRKELYIDIKNDMYKPFFLKSK